MSTGSSTGAVRRSTADASGERAQPGERALRLPARPASRWHRAGVTSQVERVLEFLGGALLVTITTGWMWSIAERGHPPDPGSDPSPTPTATIAAALTNADAPSAAYLTDAALTAAIGDRGASGKLRAVIGRDATPIRPDTLPPGARVLYSPGRVASAASGTSPRGAGIWHLALALGNAIRPVADFSLITLHPFKEKRNGRIGFYYIGRWPGERRARSPVYANPEGFIEVTAENQSTQVSDHFRLRDFLTHDQPNVWPKYMVLRMKLVDKLELVLTDLAEHGIDTRGVRVMSGFRTPQYNAGGGNPQGRAALSRHMFGDAADIYIDNNGDGQMDDLNHDHRISIDDARVILAAVDRVEAAHPELVGGAGLYTAAPGHGPFIHIDTRGYRARWIGTSGG